MRTVDDVRTLMDHWFPPQLAESWDAPGLVCGDPADEVHRVATALEATDEVVEAAIDSGAQMLLVHHPLLMRGVTTVSADTPKGRLVHRLIRAGVALMAAHTNADAAVGGVNASWHGCSRCGWTVRCTQPTTPSTTSGPGQCTCRASGGWEPCPNQ